MSQSLAKIIVHIIFSTKQRRPLIRPENRDAMHKYMAGALAKVDSPAILINSVDDHVHILCRQSKNRGTAEIVEEVKTCSSKYIKTLGPDLRGFYWQGGYGAFSVSPSNVSKVKSYISRQEAHHRKVTFQEEFRDFLVRHELEFDERYVWD